MQLSVQPSTIEGSARMPASKSHTIRALVIATLADGESEVIHPLESGDTRACVTVCRALGAEVDDSSADCWRVRGVGGEVATPDDVVDVGNSGTTLYITLTTAALGSGTTVFTGDKQIRRRPAGPLLAALRSLGAEARSTRGNDQAPIIIRGPLRGGHVSIECPTSQYLSSLLINCPLAEGETVIDVPLLHERPYVHMTLSWLARQGIELEREELRQFRIPGGQQYHAFQQKAPGDFSSATFFLVAGAIAGRGVRLLGLDMNDAQGDKAVVGYLRTMGAEVEVDEQGVTVCGSSLTGAELDLNATPDALPAMAVAGCCATGETRLVNVPQARLKETDRIRVMRQVLSAMGADIEELEDGLVIRHSRLRGARVHGHADHRVVMALAVAGLVAAGQTVIDTAESMAVTFPSFVDLMVGLGAVMTTGA